MLRLYSQQDDMAKRYVAWITDNFLKGVPVYRPVFAINCVFYGWGHRFLYDAETLELAMRLRITWLSAASWWSTISSSRIDLTAWVDAREMPSKLVWKQLIGQVRSAPCQLPPQRSGSTRVAVRPKAHRACAPHAVTPEDS
jgi:hypothetical protein